MNENTELLEYIYENAKMGEKNLTNLIRIINGKDNKIKKVIEGLLKGYENYVKDCEKILKKYKVEKLEKGFVASTFAYMEMKMELMSDNSDAKIADMLTKGLTMGKIDITKKIDNFKSDASSEVMRLAKRLCKFNEEAIELLKDYL